MDLATALDRLPKVELHCHVEGTMRPSTVMELAGKNGVELPTTDLDQLYHYTSLDSFLDVFWLVQSTLAERGDWARLAYERVLDAAAHGLAYSETFFTPARHLDAGQRLGDIVAGLDEGFVAAEAETGVGVMLICDLDRAYGPAAGKELVELLIELRRAGAPGADRVIGIGMDSTEAGVDPADYAPAFALAGPAGLRRTSHQAEVTGPRNIAVGVDVLGCERIDHGLRILEDPTLTARLATERIPLTVCPSSNVLIANAYQRLEQHPYRRMREAGLLATLNTDDPAMTGTNLGKEYAAVMAAFGFTWDDMVEIALDGVEASWLDEDDKRRLRTRVRAEADRLRADLEGTA